MSTERVYKHLDTITGVDLDASAYPYGGGHTGHGLQITLTKHHPDGRVEVLAVRLPRDDARRLADRTLTAISPAPVVEELLTPGEVARRLRVDPKTVTRWALAGKLPHVRTPGGHTRYRAVDIQALFEATDELTP